MSAKLVVMAGLAVVVGGATMLGVNNWLGAQQASIQSETDRLRQEAARLNGNGGSTAVETIKVLVAAGELRFGDELSGDNVVAIDWPADFKPEGAFTSLDDLLEGGRRVALAAMQLNEPILPAKITGPGQRPTLSKVVPQGRHAMTIRVDEVVGVAGFILPGDHVDIMLTRSANDEEDVSFTEVLLQGVRVLSIDQINDEASEDPLLVNSVTLDVDLKQAQRIRLGTERGELSLLLRRAGDETKFSTSRLTSAELFTDLGPSVGSSVKPSTIPVTVVRAQEPAVYQVPKR